MTHSPLLQAGDIVHPHRESPAAERPSFTGLLAAMRRGRPVVVNTVQVEWSSVGLVLDTRIGRFGIEGGEHDDALVLFPEGLCRVPEWNLRRVPPESHL